MYVFICSCVALTRGVVKIIQTDPDSFFSSRSGTLSSTAAPTYHLAPSSLLSHLSFSLIFFHSSPRLFLIPTSSFRRRHRRRALPPRVFAALSSHCPDAEFEIASILPPMTSLPLYISSTGKAIRGSRALLMITGYTIAGSGRQRD